MSIDLSENPSFEEQYERIKFLKEDFDKKEGWIRIMKGEKDCYWKKMFPESTIPLKVVFTFKLNMPAKAFSGMLSFEDVDFRKKWDKTFQDTEQLKKIEGVGNVIYVKAPLSFPFADRYFTLLGNDTHEVDWYGEKSYVNTVHNYKWDEPLPQAEGFVHASNGGNFYVVTPTDEETCSVFALSNNDYGGIMGKSFFRNLVAKKVANTFHDYLDNIDEGYERFYKTKT